MASTPGRDLMLTFKMLCAVPSFFREKVEFTFCCQNFPFQVSKMAQLIKAPATWTDNGGPTCWGRRSTKFSKLFSDLYICALVCVFLEDINKNRKKSKVPL